MADPLLGFLATFILLSSGLCNGVTQTTVDVQTTSDTETTAVTHTQRPHGHTTQDAKATTDTQRTPDDQTTSVAQATATSIPLTAAPWRQECKDYVDSAVRCDGPELRGFCTQEPGYAKVICARTCGFCILCEDNIDGGGGSCADLGLLGFCTAEPMYASVICPKTCNLCGQVHGVDVLKSSTANPVSMPQASTTATIATTTTTTSPLPTGTTTAAADQCRDNTAAGMSCDQLPGVCTTAFAQSLCTKYCGFC